jgi:hypothetical protein
MKKRLVEPAQAWEAALPGSVRKMIVTLMYSSLPYCSSNTRPDVDFKVHLDMQMQTLAADPVFFGLYGVQPYRSNYVEPETLYWMGMLLRHYGIEGRTDLLSKDPYAPKHILNADFDEGTASWQLQPAEPETITAGTCKGYGRLEGRYGGTWSEGDKFLLTRRSAKGPNVFRQEIRNLTPGRLYSLKMFTGDHQALVQGKSARGPRSNKLERGGLHAVSLQIENVEVLPGPEHSFQQPFRGAWGRVPPPFNDKDKAAYWPNFHWRVFRAKAAAAELRISDWASDKAPGGPLGQELMYNFIEVQPYVGD